MVAIELILHVYHGYYSSGNILIILSMGFLAGVRYILMLTGVIVIIWLIFTHQQQVSFTLLWIFIAVLGLIPKGHFETVGELLSIYNNNPSQVRADARTLMDEYAPMTCIGYQPERYPCDSPIPRNKLPSSIQRMHPGNVLILNDYILIEKFGLQGVFRGFVIFRDGSDLWKNEKSITLTSGCNTCWKIRISDGLYWYHADPSAPPIFVSQLK